MSTNSEREVIIEQSADNISEESVQSKRNDMFMPVSNVNTKAQVFLEYIYSMDDDAAREDLYDLIDQFLAQDQQSGDADDPDVSFYKGIFRNQWNYQKGRLYHTGYQ